MESNMILVGLGAFLVVVGVVLVAAQTLWAGRLSDARRPRSVVAESLRNGVRCDVQGANPGSYWAPGQLDSSGSTLAAALVEIADPATPQPAAKEWMDVCGRQQ